MTDNKMMDYLLGSLSDEESIALEARYFSDATFLEQLEAFEEEMIRDYARGQTLASVKKRIEQRIEVDPILKKKVEDASEIIKAFKQVAAPTTQGGVRASVWFASMLTRPAWLIPAISATILILVGIGAWLGTRTQRQSLIVTSPPTKVIDDHDKAVAHPVDRPIAEPKKSQEASLNHVFAVVLKPGIFRGRTEKSFSLPAAAHSLRLTLQSDIALSHGIYQIAIRREDGNDIWAGNGRVDRQHGTIIVVVPSRLFHAGRYLIAASVFGRTEQITDYSFSVNK